MPYFIGGEITDRAQMAVQTPASLRRRFNIDGKFSLSILSDAFFMNTKNKNILLAVFLAC